MTSVFRHRLRGRRDFGPTRSEADLAAARKISPLAASAAFGFAIGLVAAAYAQSRTSVGWGVFAVLTTAAAALCAVLSRRVRDADLILPVGVILTWALSYGLSSVAWLWPSNKAVQQSQAIGLRLESVSDALVVAAVGLFAWCSGFILLRLRVLEIGVTALRKWACREADGVERAFNSHRVLIVYALGLAGRLSQLALGRFGYITQDLDAAISQGSAIGSLASRIEVLAPIGLLLIAYVAFERQTTRSRTLLALVLLIEVGFGLLSGLRSEVLFSVVGVGLIFFVVRGRIPARWVLGALVAVAVLTPFNDAYREAVRSAAGTELTGSEAASLIPGLMIDVVQSTGAADLATGPVDFVSGRLRLIDEVAIVVQRTEEDVPFASPTSSFAVSATVFVPRVIWADKPVYTVGLDYAREFWRQPVSVVSARSPGYLGEAYLHGGLAAVVLLMLGLGGLTATVGRSLAVGAQRKVAPLLVASWIAFTDLEGSLVLFVPSLLLVMFATAASIRFVLVSLDSDGSLAMNPRAVVRSGAGHEGSC